MRAMGRRRGKVITGSYSRRRPAAPDRPVTNLPGRQSVEELGPITRRWRFSRVRQQPRDASFGSATSGSRIAEATDALFVQSKRAQPDILSTPFRVFSAA